jgi:hypothetical protein
MKRLSIIGLIVAFVLILAIAVTSAQTGLARGDSVPVPIGFTPPAQTHVLGARPAVKPQAAKIQANILPTFTTADVEQYLQEDDPFLEPIAGPLKLTHTITFMPSQILGQQLQQDFNAYASILCYVEFKGNGPFPLTTAHAPTAASIPHVSKAFEVFDGKTGNLLVWGGTP